MENPIYPQYDSISVRARKFPHRRIKGQSMTIPDQTMSLRQIIERFSRGLPITGQVGEPTYSDEELPDIRTLDLSERMEMAKTFQEELLNIQDKLEKAKTRKEKDALKEQLKAELAAELAAKEAEKNKPTDNQPLTKTD